MSKMKLPRIMVATDFSECSRHALDCGCSWAAAFDASLLILHAVEPVYYAAPFGRDANQPLLMSEQQQAAQQALDELVETLGDRAALVSDTIVTAGPPAEKIVTVSKEHDIDMIVIGTTGRGGLAHLLLGSVAERVVRTAECPVLTIRDDTPLDAFV